MVKRASLCALMLACMGSMTQAELVSYWPFEEFPGESSTPDVVSGYDMELITDGVYGAENHVDGKIGKAFQFFNQNDVEFDGDQALFAYEAAEGDLLPITAQPEFTISMWANVVGTGQNDWRLFSESNSAGDGNPLFNIGTANNGNNGTLDIYIRNNQASTPTVNHVRTQASPFEGEWAHIGWTYADGTHNVWVNGVLDTSVEMQSFSEIDPINVNATSIGGILRDNASHWVTGIIDEVAVWNEVLAPNQMAGLAQELTTPLEALDFTDDIRPQVPVGGNTLLAGDVSNQVFSDAVQGQGLSQYWFDGNMRPTNDVGGVDAFFEAREAGPGGTEDFPLLNPEGEPIRNPQTWWAGGANPNVVSDLTLLRYPELIAGQITGGTPANHNQYGVILQGEVFIPEDGEYYIRDGIDDFTMIAIDQDGNGELDGLSPEVIFPDDVGQLGVENGPIDDVIVLDDDWANINGGGQAPEYNGLATFEGIAAGGEWRQIEIWTAEDGGGDAGIVYMGKTDDPNIFDPAVTGDLTQEERDAYVIRPENLRGVGISLIGADASASLSSGVEYLFQVGTEGNDSIGVDDNDGLYTTTLDLTGVVARIEAGDGIEEGTEFVLFEADNLVGEDSLTLLFEDESLWSYSNGVLTFGMGSACDPNTQGDLDGNGVVDFADFLTLSGNFGMAAADHTEGDIDCTGTVDFADFLALSGNFGQNVGAQSVPEPASFAMFGLAGCLVGLLRRRRQA